MLMSQLTRLKIGLKLLYGEFLISRSSVCHLVDHVPSVINLLPLNFSDDYPFLFHVVS